MSLQDSRLTTRDVARLAADPSVASRQIIAAKLGHTYVEGWTADERGIADDVLRILARDVEVEVRAALARSIALSADMPRDVALRLARDVAEVAIPLLSSSDLLGDAELVDIIQARDTAHRLAIAGRARVSASVADALVETGEKPVVVKLVANAGAELREPTLHSVVDRFGDDEAVNAPLADRSLLPLSVAERLVARVSERLRERWEAEGRPAEFLAQETGSAAMLLIDPTTDAIDVRALVERMSASRIIRPKLLLDSIAANDSVLATSLAARLASTPYAATHAMLFSGSIADGLRLLRKAGLDSDTAQRALSRLRRLAAPVRSALAAAAS